MKRLYIVTSIIIITLLALTACQTTATPTATEAPAATEVVAATEAPAATEAAANTDYLANILAKGKMVIGTSPDWPPFEMVDADGKITGFDIELIREIAKRMGVEAEIVDMPFDSLVIAVQEGKLDLAISSFFYDETREPMVDFTDAYYFSTDEFVAADSFSDTIAVPEDFAKYTIAVGTGTTQEGWVMDNLVTTGKMTEENVFHYDRADQAVLDVKAGRVDVFMGDTPVVNNLAEATGGLKVVYEGQITGGPVMMVIPNGATTLQGELNQQIKDLTAEGFITQLEEQFITNR